jgi:hypothetical protein
MSRKMPFTVPLTEEISRFLLILWFRTENFGKYTGRFFQCLDGSVSGTHLREMVKKAIKF